MLGAEPQAGAGRSPRQCACAAKARVSLPTVQRQGTVEKVMEGEYQGVCEGAVGPEERRVQKDMMRETLEELLRESPAFKRIVAGPTAPEETRSVVSGPSGGGHGK